MDYQEFLDQVSRQIKDYFPSTYQDASVEISQTTKTNNQVLDGILIKREGDRIVPQIYLNGYFEQHENGVSMSEILTDISSHYFEKLTPQFENLPENIIDYGQMKDLLVLRLINKDMNEDMLKTVPHKDFMNTDLTAVVRIFLSVNEDEAATVQVTEKLLTQWGVDMETAYQEALNNMVKEEPAQITPLSQIVQEMAFNPLMSNDGIPWKKPENCKMEPYEQYVLTNSSGRFGAAVLLYPAVLQQLSDNMNSNYFMLPSSVHERATR